MIITFLAENWTSILLSLLTAGALGFCRHFWKEMKNYQKLLAEKEDKATEELIEQKLEPILAELEEIRKYIRKLDQKEIHDIRLIISSYRYRLVQLCKQYLKQGYMTQDQYEQLSEMYKLYVSLGGNGQAQEYYEKTCELPIHD